MKKFTRKALAISAAAAFCVAFLSVEAAAADMRSVTTFSGGTVTLDGTGTNYATSSSAGSSAFYAQASGQRNNVIGWRGNDKGNPYISYGPTTNEKGGYLDWNGNGSLVLDQRSMGVVTVNNTGKTLYVIENKADGYSNLNWTAFNVTGGTVNVTGSIENVVFASYRFSMTDRNDGSFMNSGADKLIAVSNGATLNVGQTGQTTQLKIGFGNYGNVAGGGVYVRSGLYPVGGPTGYGGNSYWGNMYTGTTQGTIQSMHSWNQRVIEATGSGTRLNFNQNTHIVTTLDSTLSEPWKGITNYLTNYYRDGQQYKDWDWADYYNNYGSRALYVGNNAAATIASGVTVDTYGTIEFNNASTFNVNSNATLKTTQHAKWTTGGANMIFTNTAVNVNENGTIDVGRNLTVNASGKSWYNLGTTKVGGTATLSNVKWIQGSGTFDVTYALSISNSTITPYMNYRGKINANSGLTLTNTSVNSNAAGGGSDFTVKGDLRMANSTFDATTNSLTVQNGKSTFTGTNTFIVDGSKTVNLGQGVSTATPIRLQYSGASGENKTWAAGVVGNEKSKTYQKNGTNGLTFLTTDNIVNAYSASNVTFMKDANTAWGLQETFYNTDGLVQIAQYQVDRYVSYGKDVKYTGGSVTNLLYTDGGSGGGESGGGSGGESGGGSGGSGGESGGGSGGGETPSPTPIVDDKTIRQELPASAKLQGMMDVHFMLAQFELMNKFQTNFNPDEFITNRKVIQYKSKARKGNKVVTRVHRIFVPYDYNVWADGQYSQVSFTNGLNYMGTDKAGLYGTQQVLDTKVINGKVGIDFISEYEGYTRLYFGYNKIDATNTAYNNTYDGSSYEAGGQLMAGLKLLGLEFQGYADLAYAYNSIKVQTGDGEITSDNLNFDLDTNTHNIKAGLGVEKRVRFADALDVGLGLDVDYVFSLSKEFKASVPYQNLESTIEIGGEYVTPKQNHHYLITGAKLFGGYALKSTGTYLYAQGTYGYQLLEQDEYMNIDQVGGAGLKYKVLNPRYRNYLATAGIGISQKIARNFNFHLQGTKLFSNYYTNDSFQARAQISYKW